MHHFPLREEGGRRILHNDNLQGLVHLLTGVVYTGVSVPIWLLSKSHGIMKSQNKKGREQRVFRERIQTSQITQNRTFSNYESWYKQHSEGYAGQRQGLPCLFLSSDSSHGPGMRLSWTRGQHGCWVGITDLTFPAVSWTASGKGKGHFVCVWCSGTVWLCLACLSSMVSVWCPPSSQY